MCSASRPVLISISLLVSPVSPKLIDSSICEATTYQRHNLESAFLLRPVPLLAKSWMTVHM